VTRDVTRCRRRRRDDAVQGRPAAGLVDQLTRGVVLTDTLRETLASIIDTGQGY
jgi:hypothetical protein